MRNPQERHSSSALSQDLSDESLLNSLIATTPKELLSLLFRFNLAESFLRQMKERQIVSSDPHLSAPASIQNDALALYCQSRQIDSKEKHDEWCFRHALKPDDLISEAIHLYRRKELENKILNDTGETLFLRYKDKLDRVLYSLLRVDDPLLCQELFYSIDSKEQTFSHIASQYSMGPEAKTQGLVGPVDLTTPHPEISARLRTAQAGHLIGPFKIDAWYAVLRLEYRFDSEYDEATKNFLRELSFKSEINKSINQEVTLIAQWLLQSPE